MSTVFPGKTFPDLISSPEEEEVVWRKRRNINWKKKAKKGRKARNVDFKRGPVVLFLYQLYCFKCDEYGSSNSKC